MSSHHLPAVCDFDRIVKHKATKREKQLLVCSRHQLLDSTVPLWLSNVDVCSGEEVCVRD